MKKNCHELTCNIWKSNKKQKEAYFTSPIFKEDIEDAKQYWKERKPLNINKTINIPTKLITVNQCNGIVTFVFEQEFKDWIKQVTDYLNKL